MRTIRASSIRTSRPATSSWVRAAAARSSPTSAWPARWARSRARAGRSWWPGCGPSWRWPRDGSARDRKVGRVERLPEVLVDAQRDDPPAPHAVDVGAPRDQLAAAAAAMVAAVGDDDLLSDRDE